MLAESPPSISLALLQLPKPPRTQACLSKSSLAQKERQPVAQPQAVPKGSAVRIRECESVSVSVCVLHEGAGQKSAELQPPGLGYSSSPKTP